MQRKVRKSNLSDDPATIAAAAAIGAAIRERRKAQGLDQVELAKAANVAVRTLSQIEAGKPTARLDVILRTAGALGMEVDLRPRRTAWSPGSNR